VVSLADLNDLEVELDIAQNDFAKLHGQQHGAVTTDAFPDRKYDGFIKEISPEANRQKATVQVKVKISKPDLYLRPEMNASVALRQRSRRRARCADVGEAGGDRTLRRRCTMVRSSFCWTATLLADGELAPPARRACVETGTRWRRGSDHQPAARFEGWTKYARRQPHERIILKRVLTMNMRVTSWILQTWT
jgi:hypothetical protein